MLAQSLSLAAVSALAFGVVLLAFTGDPLLTARVASIPTAAALLMGAWAIWRTMRAHVSREIARAAFHPYRPPVDVPAPVPTQNNIGNILQTVQTAPRSVAFNSASQSGQLTLSPASDGLVAFLDQCIRLSAPDRTLFPTVRDLKRCGTTYETYDAMLALLGDAVDRAKKPAVIRNGWTLGDLRKMAAGLDVVR